MKQSTAHKILALSLILNLIAFVALVRTIHARGGWEYLKTRFEHVPDYENVNPDAANYAHRETLFERLPKPANRIVFVGDSLTQGCEWGELYPGALNRGIGGDTSAGLLKRINTVTELKPRVIFLMIGSNDLFNLGLTPQQTLANIRSIVAAIRRSSPETPIYLESNMPTSSVRLNAHSRVVNDGLRAMADGKTIFYVDLYAAFLKGDVLNPGFTSDGGHLNGDGYMVWKHLIDPFMRRFLSNSGS